MQPYPSKPKVIVICGPTGVGKTKVAIRAAQQFGGEIIGADSMQIYRYMDIGTAKPTADEQTAARHHLIDFQPPDAPFDIQRYSQMARKIIQILHDNGKTPIIAGGSGLYIKALLNGLFSAPPADANIRARLNAEAQRKGPMALMQRLHHIDPKTAERLHPNDTLRIIRALEVFEVSGTPLSSHHAQHCFQDAPFNALKIGMQMDRQKLYARIDRRVEKMIASGLLEEVKELLKRGYKPDLNAMQSIGYRHMTAFINGRTPWPETLSKFKRDTRRYAKRQLTWFRSDQEIIWMPSDDPGAIMERIDHFLKQH